MKKKKKKVWEAQINNMKKSVIISTIIHLAVIALLDFFVILNDPSYYYLAMALLISSFIIEVINLTIGLKEKYLLTAKYVWVTILTNIATFSFYLILMEILNANLTFVRVIIILNYVILEMILIYIRIIRKDRNYITSVRLGDHAKYMKKDVIFVVVVSAIVILTAKLFDNGHIYVGRPGVVITEILGTPLLTIAIVFHVHTFGNYLYNVKKRYK